MMSAARQAFDAGFLGRQDADLSGLYDLTLLNQVLAEKGRRLFNEYQRQQFSRSVPHPGGQPQSSARR